MSELFKIVLGGILVFVVGQIIVNSFIKPIHELSRLIDEIAGSLIFYANVYCNPGSGEPEKMDEASKVLRQQASQLEARTHAIPWYKLWQLLRVVPKRADVVGASKILIFLSNSIHRGDAFVNDDKRKELEKRLRIKTKA